MELKANNNAERKVLEYFMGNATEDLKKRVEDENKTIQGAMHFVCSEMSKRAKCGVEFASDEEVYGLVMHYFEDVDAKEHEGKNPIARVNVGKGEQRTKDAREMAKVTQEQTKKMTAEERERNAGQGFLELF